MSQLKNAVLLLAVPPILAGLVVLAANLSARMTPAPTAAAFTGGAVPPGTTDLFEAGRRALDAGDLATAHACWSAVPVGHVDHARAQRFLGWRLYTETLGQPSAGLHHVQSALLADPLDSNVWQDATRSWAAVLGFGPRGRLPVEAETSAR